MAIRRPSEKQLVITMAALEAIAVKYHRQFATPTHRTIADAHQIVAYELDMLRRGEAEVKRQRFPRRR